MNIAQAIAELRDDIEAEGFDVEIMAEIAKDNGCAPQLLERKFEEQHGIHPSEYVAPTLNTDLFDKQVEAAKRRAVKEAQNLTRQGCVEPGILFQRPGIDHKHYVTVAFMGTYLLCIRVETNEVRQITFTNRHSCEQFITKQGMV